MVDTTGFGTSKKRDTAVITRKDGSKEYYSGGRLVKETTSSGVNRVRVALTTKAQQSRGAPVAIPVTNITAPYVAQQRLNRARSANAKALEAQRLAQRQSIISAVRNNTLSGLRLNDLESRAFTANFVNEVRNNKMPYGKDYLNELEAWAYTKAIRKESPSYKPYGSFVINNFEFVPNTKREARFYKSMVNFVKRDTRFQGTMQRRFEKLGLNINEADKWYLKALKGAGKAGVGLFSLPQFVANSADKAMMTGKAIFSGKDIRSNVGGELKRSFLVEAPKEVARSFDPTKPENWANIILTLGGLRATVKTMRNVGTKANPRYVPSVRNAEAMLDGIEQSRARVTIAQRFVKEELRRGVKPRLNNKLLSKLSRLDSQLIKSAKSITKIIKDPKRLKLIDFNPIVESTELLKSLKSPGTISHATAGRVKQIFAQKVKVLKDFNVLKGKLSTTAKRGLKGRGSFENSLLNLLARRKGVITGGRAQNLFVKRGLRRSTSDWDVFFKNPKAEAELVVKALRKQYPNKKISVVKYRPKAQPDMVVYRLKVDGKLIADFDLAPKGLRSVKVGKNLVADPEFLLERKVSTIGDIKKMARQEKDLGDIKRLTGTKKIADVMQDPKKAFVTRPQPKGMGADRIKFGETHMFFDLEVPTSYAYNSLARQLVSPRLLSPFKRVFPKSKFIKKLEGIKYVRANDKFTVFNMKTKYSAFPKELQARINLAKRGKLSQAQGNALRRDLVKYVKDNPNKVFPSTRTASMPKGEREFVIGEGSLLRQKGKIKFSRDPQTKLYFDVVELSFKKTKTSLPARWKNIKSKFSFAELKRRYFTKGDLAKVKRYQRQIKRSKRLTEKEYVDLVEITKRMFRQTKAKSRSRSRSKVNGVRVRRKTPIVVRKPSTSDALSRASPSVRSRSRRKNSSSKTTSSVRSRVAVRTRSRSRPRSKVNGVRVDARLTTRSRKRTRVRPRLRTRTVTRPRERVRTLVRPRLRTRTVTRPRPRVRIPASVRSRVMRTFPVRLKKRSLSDKEKLLAKKWLRKTPIKYRAGFREILFGITGFKAPTKLTGFESRVVVVKRKTPVKKRKTRVRKKRK